MRTFFITHRFCHPRNDCRGAYKASSAGAKRRGLFERLSISASISIQTCKMCASRTHAHLRSTCGVSSGAKRAHEERERKRPPELGVFHDSWWSEGDLTCICFANPHTLRVHSHACALAKNAPLVRFLNARAFSGFKSPSHTAQTNTKAPFREPLIEYGGRRGT